MIKTYELINDINLTTTIRHADGLRIISFTGGSRNSGEGIRHGRFTTANEAIQKALEADSGYGHTFRCVTPEPTGTDADPEGKNTTTEPEEPTAPAASESVTNAAPTGTAPAEEVPGITNKQGAIEWLAANRGIDGLKPTCKAEAVRNAAAIHGVSFPDWK